MSRVLVLIIFAAIVATTACGDDPPGNSDNIIPGIDAGEDASDMAVADMGDGGTDVDADDMDMGDTDAGDMSGDLCAITQCEAYQYCEDGICIDKDPCDEVVDAGELTIGTPTTVDGSFLETGTEASTAECGELGQLEQMVRFEVTERTLVNWRVDWTGQFDGLVALRTACDDPETETQCSDSEIGVALLDPGVYYLFLEVRFGNAGEWSVELTAEDPPFCDAGEATCDGDDRLVCIAGTEESRETCPLACDMGICAGDSCQEPITVTGMGGTFTGTGNAMTSTLNYAGNADCAEVAGNSTASPGYDVVFYLPGLFPGQVISVDAVSGDANVNDIYVQTTCGDADACVASYQQSENPDFVVQTAGDYFVIIEKRQASNAPFQYGIGIF